MKYRKLNSLVITATLSLVLAMMWQALIPASAFAALDAKANHDDIKIGLRYHGSEVSVSGTCDQATDLIITISAFTGDQKLKQVDKLGGIVWMNTDEVTFSEAPSVYFLRSTREPADLLGPRELEAKSIGYEALKENANVEPNADTKNALFDEFIKYQESMGLYSRDIGGIDLTPPEGATQKYRTVFEWPYVVPPGTYEVDVYEVKDGAIIGQAQSEVTVEEVGAVRELADMARDKGAIYGSAAIGVALTAGFGVGMIFRKGGGAH